MTAWPALLRVTLALAIVGDDAAVARCPEHGGIGDLRGLTGRLDYLNDGNSATGDDLGIGGVWLMPIFTASSYHGYDVTDYEQIDPRYGDLADFSAFVEPAHQRGIKVILDLVINHTSADHPWFRDALAGGPHRTWYVWRESDPRWPGVAGGISTPRIPIIRTSRPRNDRREKA